MLPPQASLPFQYQRLAGPPPKFALSSVSPSLPLASSQQRSPVARCEPGAHSLHGCSATCAWDKAILHLPGSPSSAKAGPRPLTEDRPMGSSIALLTHPVALGSCEATQGRLDERPSTQ